MNSPTLLCGDCLELMKRIPNGSIDMVLSDLPYGTTRCRWDTPINLQELWKQYRRVVKKNGAIVLFSAQPFTTELISSNKAMYRYEWIWRKTQAGTWAEKIAVQFKERDPLPVKNSYMYCNTLDMCFFYGPGDTPSMAYAGQVSVDNTDIKEGKLLEAFKKARQVLGTMKELAAKQEESNH